MGHVYIGDYTHTFHTKYWQCIPSTVVAFCTERVVPEVIHCRYEWFGAVAVWTSKGLIDGSWKSPSTSPVVNSISNGILRVYTLPALPLPLALGRVLLVVGTILECKII